jgi:molybdopterin-guanine dinucleotide biosynthesis protein MobB
MTPVDLLLIEGFKREPHDKLEIHRAANGKPLIYPEDQYIVGIASDVTLPDCPLPQLPLDNVSAIAAFIVDHCDLVLPRQLAAPAT